MSRYYARPDVAYVPIVDAAPLDGRSPGDSAAETRRIREFVQAAGDLAATSEGAGGRFGFVDDLQRRPGRRHAGR